MRRQSGVHALCLAAGVLAGLALISAQNPAPAPQAQQPVFRGGTTLIPVDIRVIDKDGKPVTDLGMSDFTVLEEGVRQQIRHFSTHTFAADTPAGAARPSPASVPVPGAVVDDLSPQDRRVFLIVLGRGRLQQPAKGVDGMLHFVRDKLLPQDQVAVLAWNRATDFTTDHATIAALLDRFKRAHEGIENKLRMRFTGLAAIYGGSRIPPEIQKDINAVFGGERATTVRTVAPGLSPNASRMADDARRDTDLLLGTASSDTIGAAQAEQIGMSLDEYVAANAQTSQDLGNMYLGVEYLRHLDGEKHLVFVSESGLQLPRGEDDRDLAAAATDARVVIDYIHTGGVGAVVGGGMGVAEARGRMSMPPPARVTMVPMMTARTITNLTGGSFYANQLKDAAADMDRIDQATRFGYLLGYYPSRNLDGKYRRITVQVNRPGVTVLYRHGYFATADVAPFSRQRILTYGRVASAAGFPEPVHDLKVEARVSVSPLTGPARNVAVATTVDVSRVLFTRNGRLKTASIELAAFVLDGGDKDIGHEWKTVELTFSDDRFEEILRSGVPVTITIPISGKPKNVKVVVYDYGSDLVGSAIVKIQ